MKKNKRILTILACGIVLCGCAKSPKLADGKEVVATIDGKEVVAEDLYAEMKDSYGTSVLISMFDDFIVSQEIKEGSDEEKAVLEDAEIELEQYKASAGDNWSGFLEYYNYSSEEQLKEDLIKNTKTMAVAKKYIRNSITEDDLKKYYEDNYSTELNVKHILIKSTAAADAKDEDKEKAEEEAYNKAAELIKKLDEGADFETLAKENSDDTGSKENGGVINGVNKAGYDSSFYAAALELKDGTYTKTPVKSQYGYHIIYTVSRKNADTYDSVKESLYSKVVDSKLSSDKNLTYKTWDEIRKKYNLNIVDTTIKTSYEAAVSNYK